MAERTGPMAADVYRNLNRECLSIRSRVSDTYGRVIAHVEQAFVKNPEFVVQPAGRERVREENRKNVHAFVRGVWTPTADELVPDDTHSLTYNPYEHDSFVTRGDERAVVSADRAVVTPGGVEAVDVTFAETE